LWIHRFAKFLLPPEIERQVGIEVGEDDVGKETALLSFERKRKLLGADLFAAGAGDVAMGADPGMDPILVSLRIRGDDNGSAGVLFG
jgi:hypothetical protein